VGGEVLLINVTFVDVVVDNVAVPLVIQGLALDGNLSFSGGLTSFASVQIGYNSIKGSLSFSADVTVASLELYETPVVGDIILPKGASLVSILVYGQYPQISLETLSNTKVYPLLTSLLYLNGVDGMAPRDVPSAAKGFGAYTLSGLTSASYPMILTLAVPDPWSVDLESLFPNLQTLFVVDYPKIGAISIPATPKSRYSMLNIIGASQITSLDLSARAASLSMGVRIVGCPLLTGVALRAEALVAEPLREYRTLVIERCGLIYLRGARGMVRAPAILRLGDQTTPALSTTFRTASSSRLLDYIIQALPTLGQGSSLSSVPSDYLPNVLVSLAESLPLLIQYPIMQTVEYSFARPSAVVASDPSGGLTTTYTQYSGGANPVVPSGSTLSSASVTVSPFGIRYTLRVTPVPVGGTAIGAALGTSAAGIRGSLKGSLFAAAPTTHNGMKIAIIVAIVIGVVLVLSVIIAIAVTRSRRQAVSSKQIISREPAMRK
jgi:hypothetical protein